VTRLRLVSSSAMYEVPAAPRLCPRLARRPEETQRPGCAGVVGVVTWAPVAAAVVVAVLATVGVPVVLFAEVQAVKARASSGARPSTCAVFIPLQTSRRVANF